MDSEKHTHMRELIEAGRPVTDEGPYYHHAWWESYKGSVKGKLGGGLLGAAIGAIAGIVAVMALPWVAPAGFAITAWVVGTTITGLSAAGMVYGIHEFAEVGKISGAVAASQKIAEKRMKAYEDSRFNEIKEELGELKALVKGEQMPEKTAAAKTEALKEKQDNYRTSHFQGSNVNGVEQFVFWKIALVGLVVGAAIGAVIASGGMAEHVLGHLGLDALGKIGTYIASMTAMGAIGASFGINRDIFRQIFDNTDLWFRGFVSHRHANTTLAATPEIVQSIDQSIETKQAVVYTPQTEYPSSGTYHRDKVMAAAQKALLEMDTTRVPQH